MSCAGGFRPRSFRTGLCRKKHFYGTPPLAGADLHLAAELAHALPDSADSHAWHIGIIFLKPGDWQRHTPSAIFYFQTQMPRRFYECDLCRLALGMTMHI